MNGCTCRLLVSPLTASSLLSRSLSSLCFFFVCFFLSFFFLHASIKELRLDGQVILMAPFRPSTLDAGTVCLLLSALSERFGSRSWESSNDNKTLSLKENPLKSSTDAPYEMLQKSTGLNYLRLRGDGLAEHTNGSDKPSASHF